MATRDLTEIFVLMRNNAIIQRSQMFSNRNNSGIEEDKVSLIPRGSSDMVDVDLEKGEDGVAFQRGRSPPAWVNEVPGFRQEIEEIHQRINELNLMHERSISRPTIIFDDDDKTQAEETQIERLSDDLTRKLHQLQRRAENFRRKAQSYSSRQEEKLLKNIILSLVTELQEATIEFRKSQSTYLSSIRNREQESERYFGPNLLQNDTFGSISDRLIGDEKEETDEVTVFQRGGQSLTSQLQLHEENIEAARLREHQVTEVVKSITELNQIFNDLSVMVVEQGAIVDRIDYNIDRAADHTSSGLVQLQKAERYQRKNRKFMCILGLAAAVLILLIILIAVKS